MSASPRPSGASPALPAGGGGGWDAGRRAGGTPQSRACLLAPLREAAPSPPGRGSRVGLVSRPYTGSVVGEG